MFRDESRLAAYRRFSQCTATLLVAAASAFSPLALAQQRQGTESVGAKDLFFAEPPAMREQGIRPVRAVEAAPTGQGGAHTSAQGARPAAKEPPAKPSSVGLRVWLTDANDASGTRRLSPQQLFRTGDRVRLTLQSNRDGYLYVVNVGSSGQTRMLFPRTGQDNRVARMKEFGFSSPLVFSEPAGTEQLVLVLSPEPVGEVAVRLSDDSLRKVSLTGNGSVSRSPSGVTGPRPTTPSQSAAQQQPGQARDAAAESLDLALGDIAGAKDLKFEDDGNELVAVSSRVDERADKFTPMVVNLRLTHRR